MTDESEVSIHYKLSPPPQCAGIFRRYLATLADMGIFCIISAPFVYPVLISINWTSALQGFDSFTSTLMAESWSKHASGVAGLWIALWWSYFIVGWGLFGATPGKWLLGLRVVDHHGRCPIGPSRAVLRLIAYCISSTILCIGHLFVLFRADRRALHDILAGTRVVPRRHS